MFFQLPYVLVDIRLSVILENLIKKYNGYLDLKK